MMMSAPMIQDASGEVPLRALVVDDDPDIRGLLEVRLQTRGYEVVTASNGLEALEQVAACQPDMLLLDVSMPEMGGLEVLERLRLQQQDVAIIMTTAFGSEQVAIEALRRGADDYLRKPFETPEFRAVIERTVRRLLLQRQIAHLRQQLDAEVRRAAEVQANLLPRDLPRIPGYDIAARCIPARQVGGDFYDWRQTPDGHLALTLGDVMGKGMPAALLMATIRAAVRAVPVTRGPAASLTAVEEALGDDLERSASFVTLFQSLLEPATGRFRFVDAGHGHGFLLRGTSAGALEPRNLPLGVLPGSGFIEGETTLEPGDSLVLYSDGLIDARPDLQSEPDLLLGVLRCAANASTMVERVIDLAVGAALPDDLTVVVLRRHGHELGKGDA